MKIKVTISDVIVELERPNFIDYNSIQTSQGQNLRTNIMNDTVLPLLKEVVSSAIELYNERTKNDIK